jgi:predicted ATP-dependent endonuclease of OLD family
MIAATASDGASFVQLRKGMNSHIEFHNFMILLEKKLKLIYRGDSYKKNTIFIMDNASIHLHPSIKQLFSERGLMCVTNAPYSPDYNPVERYFRLLKTLVA